MTIVADYKRCAHPHCRELHLAKDCAMVWNDVTNEWQWYGRKKCCAFSLR